jgi:hypothetical protein
MLVFSFQRWNEDYCNQIRCISRDLVHGSPLKADGWSHEQMRCGFDLATLSLRDDDESHPLEDILSKFVGVPVESKTSFWRFLWEGKDHLESLGQRVSSSIDLIGWDFLRSVLRLQLTVLKSRDQQLS